MEDYGYFDPIEAKKINIKYEKIVDKDNFMWYINRAIK